MNIVRELRKKAGIQQKELAYAIGVSIPTISQWEHGKTDPSGERLKKLSEYFNVDELVILGKGQNTSNPELSETEQIVQYVLDKLGTTPTTEIKTDESRLIVRIVDQMPQEDRKRALNLFNAVYADYVQKAEDKIG